MKKNHRAHIQTWHSVFSRWERFASEVKRLNTLDHDGSIIPFETVYREWDNLRTGTVNFLRKVTVLENIPADYCKELLGSIHTCVDIFMQWITRIDEVGGHFSMLARDISRSSSSDLDDIFDTIFDIVKTSQTHVSDQLCSTIRDMPFERSLHGIHTVTAALSAHPDIFPECRTIEVSPTRTPERYLEMIHRATVTITDMGRQFSPLHFKDNVYAAEFMRRIEAYTNISKDTSDDLLTHFVSSDSGTLDALGALKSWAHCHFNLLSVSCGMPIKLTQGIGRSLSELHAFAFEQFIDSPLDSYSTFTHAWNDFRGRAINTFIENSNLINLLSAFIEALIEYASATGTVLRDLKIISQHAGAVRRVARAC